MTTQVQERIPSPSLPAGRRRSARGSWILFLVATVLAALVIGVLAAVLGNAVKAVSDARGLLDLTQAASVEAETDYTDALAAEEAARAELAAQRQAVIDELSEQQNGASFSMGGQNAALAELDRREASIEQTETAARVEADAARATAASAVEDAEADVVRAEQEASAWQSPLWIAIIASGIVLLTLAVVAIVRTRRVRRR